MLLLPISRSRASGTSLVYSLLLIHASAIIVGFESIVDLLLKSDQNLSLEAWVGLQNIEVGVYTGVTCVTHKFTPRFVYNYMHVYSSFPLFCVSTNYIWSWICCEWAMGERIEGSEVIVVM